MLGSSRCRGPQPSTSMLSAIARGMRLSQDERDYLYRLAGHSAPDRTFRSDHPNPALIRILDRLDTPAQIISDLGETLVQNELATALLGDQTSFSGVSRCIVFRWFTDPQSRGIYPEADHAHHGRAFVGGLRAVLSKGGEDPLAAELLEVLSDSSPEFRSIWDEHEVGVRMKESKRILHPTIGEIELDCQALVAQDEGQVLLVYTATPGTPDYEQLQLLSVVGSQTFESSVEVAP